jgi:hypothetical protein
MEKKMNKSYTLQPNVFSSFCFNFNFLPPTIFPSLISSSFFTQSTHKNTHKEVAKFPYTQMKNIEEKHSQQQKYEVDKFFSGEKI